MSINKDDAPQVSIVIPVFNEEALLFGAVTELIKRMEVFEFEYEIIITENGSSDATREITLKIERDYSQIRVYLTDEPNYGKALKKGIEKSKGKFVICDEIDILDINFYKSALDILFNNHADMVIGSKLHSDALDRRPFLRRLATIFINYFLLNIFLGFKGTDTHGLKAFNKERLMPIVHRCVADKDLFVSELVIRAEREKFNVVEIPVEIVEMRKSRINLFKRVPNVIKNLTKLVWVIRIQNR